MQLTPSQIFIFQNLKILTRFSDTVDLCIYEPKKKLYITKSILPEDLSYYEIIAGIDHPNLAKIDFIIPNGNEIRVVREYISGDCLSDIIGGGKTYPEREAAQIVYEICCGLSALHDKKIVHRDINPNNIIITTDGRVRIIDYGIARLYKKNQSKDTINVGTPGYAAPEQYGFSQSDSRADIYAIGVMLNVLICGKYPGEQTAGGNAGKIIRKCIQMDARNRYSNILELMRDIEKNIAVRTKPEEDILSDSVIDRIMRNIPGIRTGKLYFIIPSLIWYALVIFIIVRTYTILKPGFVNYAANALMLFCTFIFPTLCFHNVFDIWNRLPLLRGTSKKGQRAFFYAVGVLSVIVGLLFMGYVGNQFNN